MNLIERLTEAVGKKNIRTNEIMASHVSFRTGGEADVYVIPDSVEAAAAVICICHEEGAELFVLGNGSNILVSDKGFRGVVMDMTSLNDCAVCGKSVRAGAGVKLSVLAHTAYENGLAGLAFAAGIPGTVGGAVVMNAGAYGGEIKDVLESVTVIDEEGRIMDVSAKDLDLGYRHSLVADKGYTVVSAVFSLEAGDKKLIKADMDDYGQRRRDKQPLEFPSAGSTFKRPEGYFAGKLIQDANLAGYRVGGACVSPKHCGFVVNDKNGTSSDIYRVIKDVQAKVLADSGVNLTMEVKLLGDFS